MNWKINGDWTRDVILESDNVISDLVINSRWKYMLIYRIGEWFIKRKNSFFRDVILERIFVILILISYSSTFIQKLILIIQ